MAQKNTGAKERKNEALKDKSYMNELKLELHEEQLRVLKRWVQTGEVSIHKEVILVEKNIVVPVTREEIVIEKREMREENEGNDNNGNDNNGNDNNGNEIIRLQISEEQIEVIKHPVVLEDISIYKHRFQQFQHIEETLKKERVTVKTTGDTSIVDKDVEKG